MVVIVLPFPVSVNRMYRAGVSRPYISKEYKKWKDDADVAFMRQRKECGTPIKGDFRYHITLDEKLRARARDGDNRQKVVLDALQRFGLIEDDKFATAGSWSWGPTDPGTCLVSVYRSGATQ